MKTTNTEEQKKKIGGKQSYEGECAMGEQPARGLGAADFKF